MSEEYHELTILGKVVGTCGGWDQGGDNSLVYYKFQANELGQQWLQYTIREKEENKEWTLFHDTQSGEVELYDDVDNVTGRPNLDYSAFNKGDISNEQS